MTDEDRVQAATGTSSESFEAAAAAALDELPRIRNTQMKAARVVQQEVTEGGILPGLTYHVTLVTTSPPPNA